MTAAPATSGRLEVHCWPGRSLKGGRRGHVADDVADVEGGHLGGGRVEGVDATGEADDHLGAEGVFFGDAGDVVVVEVERVAEREEGSAEESRWGWELVLVVVVVFVGIHGVVEELIDCEGLGHGGTDYRCGDVEGEISAAGFGLEFEFLF